MEVIIFKVNIFIDCYFLSKQFNLLTFNYIWNFRLIPVVNQKFEKSEKIEKSWNSEKFEYFEKFENNEKF